MPKKAKTKRAKPRKAAGKTGRKKTTRKPSAPRRAPAKAAARPSPGKTSQIEAWPPPEDRRTLSSPLEMVRRTLAGQDMLFLSRQVAYHLSAASELPKIWTDPDHAMFVLGKLLEHIVKRAPRRSNISMELSTHSLRSGTGVEVRVHSTDNHLEKVEASAFMSTLYSPKPDEVSGIILAELREAALRMHGRMWADLPRPANPVYHLLLPTTQGAAEQPRTEHQTFKYDIQITNYASVRKRFGIKKSLALVEQVERFVKSLVRYPMDMVMSAGEKGMITTIYETQGGGAESVASRISKRLGSERFHIGRRPVELTFQYRLQALGVTPAGRANGSRSRR